MNSRSSSTDELVEEEQKPKKQSRTWRQRIRRGFMVFLALLAVIYTVVWWNVLRIVEHDSWPPPTDAVTPAQAQQVTEEFISREGVRRDDVAIPYAPATASDVQLFLNGTQFYPSMIEDIEAAEHSVHVLMFGFTPGGWGDTFADLLIARSEAGIEVRVSVDSQGSKADSRHNAFYQRMADAGIQIVINDALPVQAHGEFPDRQQTFRQDEIGSSDHRKMLLIDGKIAWVGGAGLENHFYDGGWLDTYSRVEGDVVRQLQAVFITSFYAYGGSVPDNLDAYFPDPEDAGDIRVTVLQNIPGGFVAATQASEVLIDGSDETLDIMNAYFTHDGMIDRIADAAERGVKVRIVASQDSNVFPAQYAFQSQYDRLQGLGVEIWEVPGVLHAKVSVTEDLLILGSVNYDAWALYRNLELALLFEDEGVADDARAQLIEPTISTGIPGEAPDGLREEIPAKFWWWLRYYI